MDLFSLTIALVPVALYMLVLGMLHLRRRPYVQTGFADTMLLGLALTGMILVGPLDLFVPELAAYRYGWMFRVILLVFYLLVLLLVAMSRRPRMVVYNAQYNDLRTTIADVMRGMDDSAYWAGRAAYAASCGVDLFVDPEAPTRTIQITSLSRDVNFTNWTVLRRNLTSALSKQSVSPNLKATWLIGGGIAILLLTVSLCARDFPAFAQSFQEWLVR